MYKSCMDSQRQGGETVGWGQPQCSKIYILYITSSIHHHCLIKFHHRHHLHQSSSSSTSSPIIIYTWYRKYFMLPTEDSARPRIIILYCRKYLYTRGGLCKHMTVTTNDKYSGSSLHDFSSDNTNA